MNAPEIYRKAWDEYRTCTDDDVRKLKLERIMDAAQNNFTFEEFQAFKKTLPGYQEFWDNYYRMGLAMIENWRNNA